MRERVHVVEILERIGALKPLVVLGLNQDCLWCRQVFYPLHMSLVHEKKTKKTFEQEIKDDIYIYCQDRAHFTHIQAFWGLPLVLSCGHTQYDK